MPHLHSFRRTSLTILTALALSGPVLAQAPVRAPRVAPMFPPSPSPGAPSVAPTLTPAPALLPPPLPRLAPAQAAFLRSWLSTGPQQGLTTRNSTGRSDLSGDALSRAVLDRARALHSGRVDPSDFLKVWGVRPQPFDPLPGFVRAVDTDTLAQWTAGLTPPYMGYDGLRKGLATYERIRDAGGWRTLSADASPAAVRERLALEDPAVTPDEKLVDALQRAQRRYGLNPTGHLDSRTLTALNVPVKDRIAAIIANMERWRWIPRQLPMNRVQVNIAAAILTVFEGDTPVTSMRAVTGSPGHETPMLVSDIHSIVVNPPWNVPQSIAKNELWPKGRAALRREGYRFVATPGGGERIVQPAGPNSALGRLKFDFNNEFAVYLHDTPSRGRFASYDRLASHGCVRVEKPVALAELMMKGSPEYAGRIQSTIDLGKTQRLSLPSEVAVYLLYWTAFAGSDGVMNFRADPYGWDKLLADKIDASTDRAAATAAAGLPQEM